MTIEKKGMMFILSSPSGTGKTTLTKKLAEHNKKFAISISHTTRKPRLNEINGKDYHFVSIEKFNSLIKKNNFYEYANIFDNYYGTLKSTVKELLSQGKDILFDIDWQGTQQLMDSMQEDLVKVFVLPPSVEELEKRLHNRKQDNDNVIQERMSRAADEISHYAEYDYIIVNDNFEDSLKIIHSIIIAERYKRQRQINALNIIKNLRNSL